LLYNILSVLVWLWNASLERNPKKHPGELPLTVRDLPLHTYYYFRLTAVFTGELG